MPEPEQFDAIVLGGGKGGKTLAVELAKAGRRTALVERGMIGGSCINVACIPTKTMVRSAEVAHLVHRAAEFGIEVPHARLDLAAVTSRKDAVVAGMRQANQQTFEQTAGLEFILGSGTFSGPRQLEVQTAAGLRRITAEQVFINTGARPSLPDIPGLSAVAPLTSESMLTLDQVPPRLLVLGGGYIGLEFAQMFGRFGSQVTVIQRNAQLLPKEDPEVAATVQALLEAEGIQVLTGCTTQAVHGVPGDIAVDVSFSAGQRSLPGTHLLAAIGRRPNTESLNLAAAGIETDGRGFVRVDERLQTTAPGVWALGDVNGGPQFTHVSLDDFRIVTANLLAGGNRTTTDRLIPYTVYLDPELGRVGLTETEARRRGLDIKVARLPMSAVPRAKTLGETSGLMKAVIDAGSNRILGCAVLAAHGGEVLGTLQLAIQAGIPYTALRDGIFAHPTLVEGLNQLFADV